MRRFLLALSALGSLLFGGAFSLSFLDPLLIERAARAVVRIEVERRVGAKIDSLSNSRLVGLAQRALQQTEADIERTRQAIRNDLPGRITSILADMLRVDCTCRQRMVENARKSEKEQLSSLLQVREKLTGLIESAYGAVTRNLMREFRIFTASNAAAFALLGVITLIRRRAAVQLMLPALVLIGAVGVTGSLYLFNQNWLHTIVFGDYVGLGYMAYLSSVALLLADVTFNRARVCTQIVTSAFGSLGSGLILPC